MKKAQSMARKRTNNRLEEALALLVHNEVTFLSRVAAADERIARADERIVRMDERFARNDERFVQMDERFARIESQLADIKAILLRHEQMLQALPDAIRQKIGYESRP